MVKVINFLKSSVQEVKKVTWPTQKQLINLTISVIGASLSVGIFVSVFDYVFKEMLTILLIR